MCGLVIRCASWLWDVCLGYEMCPLVMRCAPWLWDVRLVHALNYPYCGQIDNHWVDSCYGNWPVNQAISSSTGFSYLKWTCVEPWFIAITEQNDKEIALTTLIIKITPLHNLIIDISIFPEDLKLATIMTIPKIRNPKYCSELNPISILRLLGRVREQIIHDQIKTFLETTK